MKAKRPFFMRFTFGIDWVTAVAVFLLCLVIAAWEWLLVPITGVSPILVPLPSEIGPVLWAGFANGYFVTNIVTTLEEVLYGFVIGSLLGFLLAVPVAESRIAERILSPYIVALQSIPKVAIAPVLVVWFGYGLTSKVVIVTLITFFPVFVNCVAGLQSYPREQEELFRIYRASRWHKFKYMKLQNSAPFLIAGLNVAVTLSVIGAVVAEFVGAQRGLGAVILKAGYQLETATVFAAIIVLTVISAILSSAVKAIGNWLVFWGPDR